MIFPLFLQLAAASPDTSALRVSPVVATAQQQDTTRRKRPRAIEVREQYHQRLIIHKALSYAMVPVFAAQYYAGQKLYDEDNGGPAAPTWAKDVHGLGAATIAGIFGLNTITGAMNLWESRHVEDKRWLRWSHAAIMLGGDAAFAYTGIKLASEAENSSEKRRQHRQVALWSMGITVGDGIVMTIFNNR